MTRSVEATGKTVAEATAVALRDLGIARSEADVEVINRGSLGILGLFGRKPATVRVSHSVSARERAEEVLTDILKLMGFSSQLHASESKNTLVFDIETAGADGLLIGKGGSTLSALEYVVNRMLQRTLKRSPKIVLDVSGYKRRRDDFLTSKARSLADEVKSAGREVTMEPLGAEDRRIVHNVLRGDSGVTTRSVGQGAMKSIVLAPASKGRRRSRKKK